jgi:hypothetical protein
MEKEVSAVEALNLKAIDHLVNCVKSTLSFSSKYGVSFTAITDIYKGQLVFVPWKGPTGIYHLPVERTKELHGNVFGTLLQYFDNHSYLEKGVVNFKLVHGVNFIVAQPECILSPEGEGGNIDAGTMKARWAILPNTILSNNREENRRTLL